MGLVLIAFDCTTCPSFQLITKATAVGRSGSYAGPDMRVKVGEVLHKSHELVQGGVVPGKFKVTGKHQNVGSRKPTDVQQRSSYVVLCRNMGLTFFSAAF